MKLSSIALAALVPVLGCTDVTASKDPPALIVNLTASPTRPNSCVVASPDPASIRSGQSIAFRNNTGVAHTILADGSDTPWTSIEPGGVSGALSFSAVSTRKYYVLACGDGQTNLHTLVVTVN
jgi:plastocyanin